MAKSGNGRKLHTGRGHRKLMRILAYLLVTVVCMASFCVFLPQSLNAEGAEEDGSLDRTKSVQPEDDSDLYDGLSRTLTAEDEGCGVSVTFSDAAGIPEDASLSVTALMEDSDEYQSAQRRLLKERADEDLNEDSPGMKAFDISLLDGNGNEIEPEDGTSVQMQMKLAQLDDEIPDGTALEIRHLQDLSDSALQAFSGFATRRVFSIQNSSNLPNKKDETEDSQVVARDVIVQGGQAEAEFSVTGFSVFAITWTRDSSSSQRVGSVRIHTVDENGNEMEDPDTYTATELSKMAGESGILTLSDWVKTKTLPGGSVYQEARLNSISGKLVTGFKVASSGSSAAETFTLQYTSDATVNSSSTWRNMEDAISGQEKNDAEVYLIYHKAYVRPVKIHFLTLDGTAITDSDGNELLDTIDAADHISEYDLAGTYVPEHTPDGYSFSTTRMNTSDEGTNKIIVGDSNGTITVGNISGIYYRYLRYQNGKLQMARGDKNWTEVSGSDVYITFSKDETPQTAATFTVHYVNDQKQTLEGQEDTTFALGGSGGSSERDLDSGYLVRTIDGKVFIGSYLGTAGSSLTENTTYVTTDYLHVSKVKVNADGTRSFLIALSDEPMTLAMTRSNRWSCTAQNGRTFTLRREITGFGDNQSVRYSLVDDQIGTSAIDLNLKQTDDGTEVYVGSTESENASVVYTVTAITSAEGDASVTTYSLSVSEWQQNDQTDIYQVYGDPSTTVNPEITVRNDLVYTGHLVVQMDDDLQNALNNAGAAGTAGAGITDVSYKWYKIVNNASEDAEGTPVERKQSGYTWNIAQNENERTWLDLSADGGALNASQSSVRYYCVLTYKIGETQYTATSNKLAMINYDELWNGGFETPSMSTNQVSNSWYYTRGVWRTTGLGTGGMRNHDIEIINTMWAPYWKNSYNWNPSLDFKAHGGNQFAELNCEAAGALYQDVVTHPYETLNYWLSHRARGRVANSTPEYDTMYLVIMPTKLAMTSGSDGGELKEQADLEAYIRSHGGFASNLATGEEAEVTYRDETSGVLIERISSSDQAWHDISVANGYTAMAGLTRFFFVAGPTASGSNTVGNFLDDVGFSQQLPKPETNQFQVVVTKTFSNLELSDIAGLEDSFALTIRAYAKEEAAKSRADDGGTENTEASLDSAKLTFSASSDGSLTLSAKQGDNDLFAAGNGSNGAVTVNDDAGTVTMTWTLLDNSISGTVYYTIDETVEDLSGYTAVMTQDGSVQHTGSSSAETVLQENNYAARVSGGDVLYRNFTNSYNRNSQISVQKIFSGITPTTVHELADNASNPYQVILTKKADDGSTAGTALHLIYNEQKPYSDDNLPSDVQNVSFSIRQGSGGISILTWTITGWDAGGYQVEESGYHPQGEASQYNTLASVTINGGTVSETHSSGGAGAEVSIQKDITIGGSSPDVPSVKESGTGSGTINTISSDNNVVLTDTETNLLISEYHNGESTGYLVWTPDTLGANVRQAILNYIRTKFDDSNVTLGQISFYSSENPGVMPINDANVRYDADTRSVTFTSSTNTTWQRYYGTSYTLERTVTQGGNTVTEIVANDEPEIRIRNNYNPILKIQKVEKNHNDRLLGGAIFRIYRYKAGDNGDNNKEYYLTTSTVSSAQFGTISESGSSSAKEFTTSAQATETVSAGTVTVGVLPEGTYYLEETHAPDGYNRVPDIPFAVSGDGVVTLLEGSNPGNSVSRTTYAEVTLTDPYYTITVSDTAGQRLPDAGGYGGGFMSPAYLLALTALSVMGGLPVLIKGRKNGAGL